jgi:hypothetical protein
VRRVWRPAAVPRRAWEYLRRGPSGWTLRIILWVVLFGALVQAIAAWTGMLPGKWGVTGDCALLVMFCWDAIERATQHGREDRARAEAADHAETLARVQAAARAYAADRLRDGDWP